MVLYTVIGEYDVLYAQNRELKELAARSEQHFPEAVLSTDPQDFLDGTVLHNKYTNNKTNEVHYNEYN